MRRAQSLAHPLMFADLTPTDAERTTSRPGDDLVHPADVIMDRAFTVQGTPADVWPWLIQLGKGRAGWYLPRTFERLLPPSRRATRTINADWQTLTVGDVIPDYGGRHETFEVAAIDPNRFVVYRSKRRHTHLTWSITLQPAPPVAGQRQTRVFLRLRMAPIRHQHIANSVGETFDLLSVAGMAAGLRERLNETDLSAEGGHVGITSSHRDCRKGAPPDTCRRA